MNPAPPFDLIETMRFDPLEGLIDLERHLSRMRNSAAELGFAFDRHAVRNELQAATFRLTEPRRVRLLCSSRGAVATEARPLPPPPAGPVRVRLLPLPLPSGDVRLRHKTTDRAAHRAALCGAGTDEALFVDEEGFLTEGSYSSVFVPRGERLLTPPLSRGLIAGVLRDRLLEEGRAAEAELTPADLDGPFFVGNALRGLLPTVAEGWADS